MSTYTTTEQVSTPTPVRNLQPGQAVAYWSDAIHDVFEGTVLAVLFGEDTVSVVWSDQTSTDFGLLDTVGVRTMEQVTRSTEGDAIREQAKAAQERAHESFERCDTDGFMSQHANQVAAMKLNADARLADQGGREEFAALFDATTGELVAAKLVDGKFGPVWGVLTSDDPASRINSWVNESKAGTAEKRRAALVRKGYTLGSVRAAARTIYSGNGYAVVRTDGGFSREVEIVSADVLGWY